MKLTTLIAIGIGMLGYGEAKLFSHDSDASSLGSAIPSTNAWNQRNSFYLIKHLQG